MVATASRPGTRLPRFDRGERVLHWANALLMLTLLVTGAAIYVPQLSELFARRHLIEQIHVWSGVLLPFPLVLTVLSGPWGRAFRADARRLNRWSADDRRWLRTRGRDPRARNGKFNAGQKLNAAFIGGAIPVMLATGLIMNFPKDFPLAWRTGATFVHDWVFIGLAVVVAGHILFAVNDPLALRSMLRGWVPESWARRHAPRWLEELRGEPPEPSEPGGPS